MVTELQAKHATRVGREIPPGEISTKHRWAARGALLKWLAAEVAEGRDRFPNQRRDLKANLKLIMDEIGQRTGRRPAE